MSLSEEIKNNIKTEKSTENVENNTQNQHQKQKTQQTKGFRIKSEKNIPKKIGGKLLPRRKSTLYNFSPKTPTKT